MNEPKAHYDAVGTYGVPINGRYYGFSTLVSRDGIVAWMPDNEQQHVNLGYNGKDGPAKLSKVSKWDVARMLGQMHLFQAKSPVPLEDILSRNRKLISTIQQDFQTYHANMQVSQI